MMLSLRTRINAKKLMIWQILCARTVRENVKNKKVKEEPTLTALHTDTTHTPQAVCSQFDLQEFRLRVPRWSLFYLI